MPGTSVAIWIGVAPVQRQIPDLLLLDGGFDGGALGLQQFRARLNCDLLLDIAQRQDRLYAFLLARH